MSLYRKRIIIFIFFLSEIFFLYFTVLYVSTLITIIYTDENVFYTDFPRYCVTL